MTARPSVRASAAVAAQRYDPSLRFRTLHTEHFDIYYYDREADVVNDVGRMAERWYFRLSKTFNHSFNRKPIVLYDVQSIGAQAYMAVAHELMAREEKIAAGVPDDITSPTESTS